MADALRTIRKVINDFLEYTVLSDVVTGTIISVNPISVRIDVNLTLTDEFIHIDIPIPPGAVGQSVTLIRHVKGQSYTLLNKRYWR